MSQRFFHCRKAIDIENVTAQFSLAIGRLSTFIDRCNVTVSKARFAKPDSSLPQRVFNEPFFFKSRKYFAQANDDNFVHASQLAP
jgi:hypothetical protein